MEPIQLTFKDDGKIPNSKLPLLIYRGVFLEDKADADAMIAHFKNYGWRNAWKNGVYDYHHYHSITHEVIGIYQGYATLQFGGENGERVSVEEGDVIVIPAGVGHKRVDQSEDFAVVGAYPNGCDYDIMKGEPGERPKADENIAKVELPENDPVYGKMEGLLYIWHNQLQLH
ncbi:cupin domain-containing protein [Flavobacterium silvaticum]|uniref:Cupin domain-containing protein n=1 Tax=Flavobacterium silvaticum TaxID=1852020 RepID=A0A972JJM5_9FLAO|nr:cupin domain-containing protein [Flavobacterium silvaticum]NMH28257.1 cupin domain-containing protein [Flavobacterium silvaticum]